MPDYTVGWVYNLQDENATTDAGSLITVAITFAVIATLAVALRFYVRLSRVSKSLALDDWIALIAVVRVILSVAQVEVRLIKRFRYCAISIQALSYIVSKFS